MSARTAAPGNQLGAPATTSGMTTFARLGECLLLGVCCTAAALGAVTAAPGLAAAATVVRAWESGRQPRLAATFLATVRTETRGLLGPQLALTGILAVAAFGFAVAGAGLPGGDAVRVVAGIAGAFTVLSFLLMFPAHAAHGGSWWLSWSRAAESCVRRPWLPIAAAVVLGAAAVITAASPPLVLAIAGPVMLAAGVLFSRADTIARR